MMIRMVAEIRLKEAVKAGIQSQRFHRELHQKNISNRKVGNASLRFRIFTDYDRAILIQQTFSRQSRFNLFKFILDFGLLTVDIKVLGIGMALLAGCYSGHETMVGIGA